MLPVYNSIHLNNNNKIIVETHEEHYDKIEVSKKVSVCKPVRKPVCKFPSKFTLQNNCVSF